MKPLSYFCCTLFLIMFFPLASYGLGLEVAIGGWIQTPTGDVSYEKTSSDDEIDLQDDMDLGTETNAYARLKVDMPLFIPNIYLMATPMEFDGTGQKNVSFTYGEETFSANVDFDAKVRLDHLDVGLYYGLPFIETATADHFNVDLGINFRIIDFMAEIDQGSTEETKTQTLILPMGYIAAQLKPVDKVAIEAELRGVTYSGNHFYSLIGRLKYKPFGPFFAAAGYRHENLKIDEGELEADITIGGPFAEIGLQF